MINNERQYRITRSQLERFLALAEELRAAPHDGSDLLRGLQLRAAEAQVKELSGQVEEYEGLRSGAIPVGGIRSLDELPDVLTRARIASGLTQKALGDRLGIQEQQVQRYEANRWSGASFSRLSEVAEVLSLDLNNTSADTSSRELIQAARQSGLDQGFIQRRLLPKGREGAPFLLDFASRMNRVFGLLPSHLLSSETQSIELPRQLAASYKLPVSASEPRVRAHTMYTHYLALLTLDATPNLEQVSFPNSAQALRALLLDEYGAVNFRTALACCWNLGIPVLPLSEPGGFHAIVWRTNHRNVIVLKQGNRSESRWLFDLLHEFKHVLEEPVEAERVSIDEESTSGDLEAQANQFAGAVLLNNMAEDLVDQCVTLAKGNVSYLKRALPQVAQDNNVAVADLANYMAYRLSLQDVSWWGTAASLQAHDYDPWSVARDEFLAHADLTNLVAGDRELLIQAIAE